MYMIAASVVDVWGALGHAQGKAFTKAVRFRGREARESRGKAYVAAPFCKRREAASHWRLVSFSSRV